MARIQILAAAISIAALSPAVDAQQIASEQDRREAIQFYRVGQEFLSGEQFDKAAEQG
jgi:hypothetical protein